MSDIVSLVLEGAGKIAERRNAHPDLPADAVRARAGLTGVSAGTERMWYEGSNPAIRSGRRGYPYFPGYEFVGAVEEVGTDVTDVAPGQRVFAMKPHASHAVLRPTDYWVSLPDHVADEDAIGIALTATALHAAHRAPLRVGDTGAVVGMGTVGFLCLQVLKAAGASTVVAVSRSARKRALALELGADLALAPNHASLVGAAHERTGGRGADVVFECAGVGRAVQTAMELVRPQGHVVIAGFHTDPFPVSGELFFSKEATLHSVRGSGSTEPTGELNRWSRRENVRAAAELVASGKIRMAPLVTHRVQAPDLAAAYEIIGDAEADFIQVIMDWRGGGV